MCKKQRRIFVIGEQHDNNEEKEAHQRPCLRCLAVVAVANMRSTLLAKLNV